MDKRVKLNLVAVIRSDDGVARDIGTGEVIEDIEEWVIETYNDVPADYTSFSLAKGDLNGE